MVSSFLYPPNSHTLSNNVIGSVMQRGKPRGFRTDAFGYEVQNGATRRKGSNWSSPYSFRRSLSRKQEKTSTLDDFDLMPCTTSRVLMSYSISSATPISFDSKKAKRTIVSSGRSTVASRRKPTAAGVLDKKLRHRERCRKNHEIYRQKQRELMLSLETQIQDLRREIRELNKRPYGVSPAPTTQPTIWVVAVQYFQQFQNFCSDPIACRASVYDFLQATMATDVVDGLLFGVEELLDSWARFSLYFDKIHFTLTGLTTPDSGSLVASTITSVTFSKNSFRYAFPHLNSEGRGSSGRGKFQIAANLLGQRVVMRGSVRIDLDDGTNRVERMQSQSDMLTPLLSILGSLEDVARVFEGASVTPDCKMIARK